VKRRSSLEVYKRLLKEFGASEFHFSEVVERLQMSEGVTGHYLKTLQEHGFIEKHNKHYRLLFFPTQRNPDDCATCSYSDPERGCLRDIPLCFRIR